MKFPGSVPAEWRTPMIYFFASVIWILFSDMLLFDALFAEEALALLSTIKGWFFVTVTALLLFFFLRKDFRIHREKEHSLQKVNLLLQSVFDSLTDALFVLTPDLRLHHFNKRAEVIFGSLENVAGRDAFWER